MNGEPLRARIDLPQGFEFAVAEVASGTTRASGALPLSLSGSHAHMARLDIGPTGIHH